MFKSINPFDQSVIAEHPLDNDQAIQTKLELATKTYSAWRKEDRSIRIKHLENLAEVLNQKKDEFARIMTLEMGKTLAEARIEIEKSIKACKYFIQEGDKLLADQVVTTEAKRSYVSYHPIGAVFGIMPWNFPFWQVFRFALPTILGGNVALLKHAPNVCMSAKAIEKIFLEAGFPDGVFQSLIIDVDKVEGIIQTSIVQGITLTGSEYAGSQVAALAGKHIKKSVLELGGSDAFIVLEDADLEKAAKVGAQSRMQNAGQSCIAAKRFIVIDKIKDEFMNRFRENAEALRSGNPLDSSTTIGLMARLDLAEKLEGQMDASVKAGAKVIIGGSRNGCNFLPTILDGVVPGMKAFEEETFGPMAAIISAKDENECVRLANQSRYGLGGSIWTSDLDKAASMAKNIESGSVYVNMLMRSDVRLPFGGIKKSGYGRELSGEGLKEFLNIKTIVME